ncbi:MAG: chemotaxis protein CheW [Steroidobacteraceae bacterium]
MSSADNHHNFVASDDASQYLTFMVAGEEYGVEILRVQGIQGWDRVTQIPNAPPYVLGVINLRGAIVPIVDLRVRLGLEPMQLAPTTVVIVVKAQVTEVERTVGLVVDAVSDVHSIGEGDRRKAPDFGQERKLAFISALGALGEKMVILLDLDVLLDDNALPEAVAA